METVCTSLLQNSKKKPSISFAWLQNFLKSASANSAGEANSRSLPLLICPSRAAVSLHADTAQLQSHKPLSSWTSPSGESCGSPLRSPPALKEPAERPPPPRAPFLPGSAFPAEHPALSSPGQACNFPPSLALTPLGWSPRDAAFPRRPRPRASRSRAERPHPSPGAPRAASRAHARPPPLPAGGAASPAAPPLSGREPEGARDAARRPAPAARRAALLRE